MQYDQKKVDKLSETAEEKRNRRLDKKVKKEEKRKKKEADLCGYTNESNPFGDSNLAEKFVWKLKEEKEHKHGRNDKVDSEREKRKRDEIRKEIEKVKRRREEREYEKQRWEEEKARLQREQDSLAYQDWEKKEDEFYLKQAKDAAENRIKQGRAKPIDILYKNINMDADFDFEMNEPYKIFKGLSMAQLEELENDIRVYLELDSHHDFWQSLMIVCKDEVAQARKRAEQEKTRGRESGLRFDDNTGVHQAVRDDVQDIFRGKSSAELEELHQQILQTIESGAAMDKQAKKYSFIPLIYWEDALKKLVVYKAQAKLKEIHASLLKQRLSQLEDMHKSNQDQSSTKKPSSTLSAKYSEWESTAAHSEQYNSNAGNFSPELVHSLHEGEEVVDPEVDNTALEEQRQQVLNIEAKKLRIRSDTREIKDKQLTEDEMYRIEAEKAMEEDEEQFNIDMPVESQVYSLNDKYRPRKPKFFNRVHTGYEWNKYNQTHYDHDNPPPKVVQGYKFNIFYPDLLDMTKTPQYIVQSGPTADTCLLLFKAGPPYEEIAFKIVDREWEYSHKKGFKCTFERGILHLWFNFKRYRYRR